MHICYSNLTIELDVSVNIMLKIQIVLEEGYLNISYFCLRFDDIVLHDYALFNPIFRWVGHLDKRGEKIIIPFRKRRNLEVTRPGKSANIVLHDYVHR